MRALTLSDGSVTYLDDDDFQRFSTRKWQRNSRGYAHRSAIIGGRRTLIALHRAVLAAPTGQEVDHINGDPLDNRRANLRLCTRAENARNVGPSSTRKHGQPFKGISLDHGKRWKAYINLARKYVHLGCFATAEEAARAYDSAARAHFGEFARLNFPEPEAA